MHYTFSMLQNETEMWARERQIIQNSSPMAQAHKTLEEAGELLEAATRIKVLKELIANDSELADHDAVRVMMHYAVKAYKDAIGDVTVTTIVGSATADVDFVECLGLAYEEIKPRKGWLDDKGVFHKVTA